MIGKGKAIAHTQASMAYGWNQEKDAEIVYRELLVGDDPREITKEFEMIQEQNVNCEKNTLSFVLSPAIEDGQKLNNKELGKITEAFIKEMKLQEHQAIAFVHKDKEHKHVHLYVNRIDFEGKAYNDQFVGKRSQQAAERVAQEMNLTTARERQEEKLLNLRITRNQIMEKHQQVMRERPRDLNTYMKGMQKQGVEVKPYINKSKELQGFRFVYKGQNLKGSEVNRAMSGSKIVKGIYQAPSRSKHINPIQAVKIASQIVQLNPAIVKTLANKVVSKVISASKDRGIEY
ncbi:Relaxase/Mobilisation nuclease domain-containing protein [Pustulibacterium marinum]|uniref:Relaxase/Mobilisation nuclease domain-containing protein n=1 Tax=Pustulibacterium marinum TaxID=1224947 RepID=A0A1I7HFZ3_9FLAO|nr:relaxase/mobilization nuclease domain-containing protein [Pustulibacterium marinum]SFU59647.1 Relaxase/Mobilisation nuclease domain-containing protein [Pustulibacterium marinum]